MCQHGSVSRGCVLSYQAPVTTPSVMCQHGYVPRGCVLSYQAPVTTPSVMCQHGSVPRGCVLSYQAPVTTPSVMCQHGSVPRGCVLSYQAPVTTPSTTDPPPFIYPLFDPIDVTHPTDRLLYTSLKVSANESRQFELDTRDHYKCPQWFRLREHRITASNFKHLRAHCCSDHP
ncbi:hypothetical protein LSAT2_015850 [Lamellibrachia satsuma]|nr:hypothetical protein LSAT2_015850 [Lamellibrachia satsuma]